jgi:subtilase family serine protease
VSLTLTLTGKQPAAAQQYAVAVSTPGAGHYRRFLDLTQLRERFGAPDERVTRVSRWAQAAGFRVGDLDATGTRLPITGATRVAEKAFGVTVRYSIRDGARVRTAPTARVPVVIARDVTAVSGLHQHVAQPLHERAAPPASATTLSRDGVSCSTYWAQWNNATVPQKYPSGRQSNQLCGYTGPQLRALYGLNPADTGAGQTIVIVGAYNQPSTLADANATFALNGVAALPASRYQVKTYPTGGGGTAGCDEDSWHLEQALDVQTVHSLAPHARVVYVAAADCTQLEETLAKVITDTALNATIVSNSWGIAAEPADSAYLATVNSTLARAAILGVGTYFASGDTGDTTTATGSRTPAVTFPASSPWATAVGGTTSAIGQNLGVQWQTGWENAANTRTAAGWTPLSPPFIGGAGGGRSAHFDKPTWQSNIPGSRRAVPDIAALADPYTGLLVGSTVDGRFGTGPVGGTSLATPVVASLAALAQAKAGAGSVIGFLAPTLYANKAAGAATTADVQHVAAGIWTPAVPGEAPGEYLIDIDAGVESLSTTSGWDPVTGLGTPGRTFLTDVG